MSWEPKGPNLTSKKFDYLSRAGKDLKHYEIKDILDRSNKFPIPFPINTGRLEVLQNKKNITKENLTKYINSVYPFLHESILDLYIKFIEFKQKHGSDIEKAFYKKMNLKDFVDRLLKRRAVMFMGKDDKYLLLNGEKGSKNWETIGTDNENPPLILKNCLTYDEIKLSAFLYVSSYTHFVNIGDRTNMGVYSADRTEIEDEGIIAGMIGSRLKKPGVMDYQEMVLTSKQNTESNGYGNRMSVHKLFADFFEEENLLYNTSVQRKTEKESNRFVDLKTPKGAIFDNRVYSKRLAVMFDCLLLEANSRAKEAGKTAFIHVVGLGLGVWMISDHQEKVYMECFYERIMALSEKLSSVSDICFSYFNQETCGGYKNGSTIKIPGHPSQGINILIYRREPHEKLGNNSKLLVVSYAWDGNALPGNEYWSEKLASSGDSAAASSTQIAELHNPHINPLVCADNLRIVTGKGYVMTLAKYTEENRKS
ncbi:unnamed protein product [Ceutorhynchus assimilis]|uniref:Uncharacterized protein n=1 Tax=Ceutorhynchus assimilis TaxID=467358 RepID=A0A9N9QS67_9CUCU|nr:unnamed protein product [Ceutorhynchus assimilis]